MSDKLFGKLKETVDKNNELNGSVLVKVSDNEMSILVKKAEALGMDKETLLREYIINDGSAFDGSVFEGKKRSKSVKVGNDNE